MGASVTLRDIARHAAVSVGTVSRVLNNHDNVDADLRRSVLRAVSDLGYVAQRTAGRGRGRGHREVGFFLSLRYIEGQRDLMAPFWAHVLHGAETEGRAHGLKVTYRSLHGPSNSTSELRELVAGMNPTGALLVGAPREDVLGVLDEFDVPIVLVDTVLPGHDAVLSDNFSGAHQAVTHLIEFGHRDIAFIGGPLLDGSRHVDAVYSIKWRALGYRTALAEAGLVVHEELLESCDLTADGGYDACRRLLEAGAGFTAIFCGNDPTATGVLRALREVGRDVPEHVSVVGFDDELAEHTYPALTTVRVDKEEMGAVAVRTLMQRQRYPDSDPLTITTPVELVRRDSVTARSTHPA